LDSNSEKIVRCRPRVHRAITVQTGIRSEIHAGLTDLVAFHKAEIAEQWPIIRAASVAPQ
jgi:hypothetical protein